VFIYVINFAYLRDMYVNESHCGVYVHGISYGEVWNYTAVYILLTYIM